jgi:transcription elongation GreA/GreB family factor
MNKKELIANFIKSLEDEAIVLKAAAQATHEAATNEESRPENQYDTRALEASYLAEAQSKRVHEIDELIVLFRTTKFKDFESEDPVDISALVDVKLDGQKKKILIMPKGGGVTCELNSQSIQIVTPTSIFGEALMGLTKGDEAEFEVGNKVKTFEVLAVN